MIIYYAHLNDSSVRNIFEQNDRLSERMPTDIEERTASFPNCPDCDGQRTYRHRPNSKKFVCPDCKIVFATNGDKAVIFGPVSMY